MNQFQNCSYRPVAANATATAESETNIDMDEWSTCSEPLKKNESIAEMVRKTGVAVAGGTMVGLGLIMIPLPIPIGCVVTGAGMSVLGTEFPAAQRVLDKTRDAVVDVIEKNCNDEETEEDFVLVPKRDDDRQPILEEFSLDKAAKDLKVKAKQFGKKALPVLKKMGSQSAEEVSIEMADSTKSREMYDPVPELTPSGTL